MSERVRIVVLSLVIAGGVGMAFWNPSFGYWITHDGFPIIFGVIGVLALVSAIVRMFYFQVWGAFAKGNLMIGVGSLMLSVGYILGQWTPVVGSVCIVGGIIPWGYGLYLQSQKRRLTDNKHVSS